MNPAETNVLQSFHQFLGRQLESASAALISPEQALALWREEQETIAAVREGLADVNAGRTKPLDQFDREFRQRHGLEPV